MFTDVFELLNFLGVTANYLGFHQTACAVSLCVEQPERLALVTKCLYPQVAERCGTDWRAVERNVRTVRNVIWRDARDRLERVANRRLMRKPGAAQLLAILAACLTSDQAENDAELL